MFVRCVLFYLFLGCYNYGHPEKLGYGGAFFTVANRENTSSIQKFYGNLWITVEYFGTSSTSMDIFHLLVSLLEAKPVIKRLACGHAGSSIADQAPTP